MPGTTRYTDEPTHTTPASLEAMARTLDEIRKDVKEAVATATEARDFAKQSSDFAGKLVAYNSLPTSVKIAAIIGGAALGGGGVSMVFHFLKSLIA